MKNPSVMEKVLSRLLSQEWVGADEFERMFPEKVEGHRSWGQRLRDLRLPKNGSYNIIYRTKKDTKHLTEWHIEQGNTSTIPQIKAETGQGEAISPKVEERHEAVYFERDKQLSFIG